VRPYIVACCFFVFFAAITPCHGWIFFAPMTVCAIIAIARGSHLQRWFAVVMVFVAVTGLVMEDRSEQHARDAGRQERELSRPDKEDPEKSQPRH
jgi:hypothetical protein